MSNSQLFFLLFDRKHCSRGPRKLDDDEDGKEKFALDSKYAFLHQDITILNFVNAILIFEYVISNIFQYFNAGYVSFLAFDAIQNLSEFFNE